MKHFRQLALCAVAIAVLAACGGGGDETTAASGQEAAASRGAPRANYSRLVSFGDSLSDVGSYRTPGIAYLGGGRYTVNGPTASNWTELLAATISLPAPCAAQTGLEASGPLAGLAAPIENHAGCFAYGQGGSRVTHPIGIANKALLQLGSPAGALGQLTDPIVNQITRHLAATGGRFDGSELVTVLGGGNDLFVALDTLQATLAAGGDFNTAVQAAFGAMAQAGGELAAYVKTMIVANGARRVVVVNLPDVGTSPSATAGTKDLITGLVAMFNSQLANGLAGDRRRAAGGCLCRQPGPGRAPGALRPAQRDHAGLRLQPAWRSNLRWCARPRPWSRPTCRVTCSPTPCTPRRTATACWRAA